MCAIAVVPVFLRVSHITTTTNANTADPLMYGCWCSTKAGLDKCHFISEALSVASSRRVDIATASDDALETLLREVAGKCGVAYYDGAVAGLKRMAAGAPRLPANSTRVGSLIAVHPRLL